MNKLLKMVGVALLVSTIFSCTTGGEGNDIDISGKWSAKIGDTFTVARIYDGTGTTFDYTGLGLNDSSLLDLYAVYTDINNNILVSAKILFYHDGLNPPKWVLDNSIYDDGDDIRNYGVSSSIYRQYFANANYYCEIDFAGIDDKGTKVSIVVNDTINRIRYNLEGNHNGNGAVKVVSITE